MGNRIINGLPAGARARTLALSVATAAALACLCAVGTGSAAAAGSLTVPPGFQATTLHIPRAEEGSTDFENTIQYPTAIDFGPQGEMFVAERNGRVKLFSSVDDVTPTLIADINADVMGRGDRGVLGMKLDPEFPKKAYLYLLYTHDAPIGGQAPSQSDDPSGADYCDEGPPFTDCVASGRVVRLTLDPDTDIPEGGVDDPSQKILVESWCQQFTSHSIGDLEFDSSGALLVGGGDGASWEVADNGQFSNACGDPPKAGGSLRAQDLRSPETPSDPTQYNGSIIRIDPATGDPLPDNPLFGGADVRARRTLVYGLRNPFRFEIRPGTDELFIGDVGWYSWEELDKALSPPLPGEPALNFGWPCYEGNAAEPDWANLAASEQAPLCKSLYEEPGAVTPPLFTYVHETAGLFPGDACSQLPGSATSGLAFYEPPEGVGDHAFPASYDGALLMADASRGCLWAMRMGPDGTPDPSSISNLVTPVAGLGLFTPVDITLGPDGALYVPNFFDSSIVRISYSSSGQPPVAKIAASKTYGADDTGPLEVEFDASESADPDGDAVHYAWDLDGDGEFDDGADEATASAQYSGDDNVVARVKVSDEGGNSDFAQTTIYPGDLGPPVAALSVSEIPWTVGERVSLPPAHLGRRQRNADRALTRVSVAPRADPDRSRRARPLLAGDQRALSEGRLGRTAIRADRCPAHLRRRGRGLARDRADDRRR
jgi:glucose/arabinose dehydrogenase